MATVKSTNRLNLAAAAANGLATSKLATLAANRRATSKLAMRITAKKKPNAV